MKIIIGVAQSLEEASEYQMQRNGLIREFNRAGNQGLTTSGGMSSCHLVFHFLNGCGDFQHFGRLETNFILPYVAWWYYTSVLAEEATEYLADMFDPLLKLPFISCYEVATTVENRGRRRLRLSWRGVYESEKLPKISSSGWDFHAVYYLISMLFSLSA